VRPSRSWAGAQPRRTLSGRRDRVDTGCARLPCGSPEHQGTRTPPGPPRPGPDPHRLWGDGAHGDGCRAEQEGLFDGGRHRQHVGVFHRQRQHDECGGERATATLNSWTYVIGIHDGAAAEPYIDGLESRHLHEQADPGPNRRLRGAPTRVCESERSHSVHTPTRAATYAADWVNGWLALPGVVDDGPPGCLTGAYVPGRLAAVRWDGASGRSPVRVERLGVRSPIVVADCRRVFAGGFGPPRFYGLGRRSEPCCAGPAG
jgi:hypothetical protein